jgi:type IV secretion system protein TrbG
MAGERRMCCAVVGEPQIGDSVGWNVAPAIFGKRDESTAMLVLKPQMSGLDANLLITTDRRAYHGSPRFQSERLRLASGFCLQRRRRRKQMEGCFAEQDREEVAAGRDTGQIQRALLFSVERPHFDYQIKGGEENIRPQRVFNDGSNTYIQMSPDVPNRVAPVLMMVVGADPRVKL